MSRRFPEGSILQKQVLWLAILGMCLIGCVGTDYITAPINLIPPRVVVAPATKAVQVGATATFQASYYDSLGRLATGVAFQWASSAPSIASIDANGQAMGHQPGQAQIVATVHGVSSGPAVLTVVADPNQVATVTVTPDSGRINTGESFQFTAASFNLNGTPLTGRTYTWQTSNATIATVDQTGKALALAPGSVEITASTGGVTGRPAVLYVFGRSRQGTFVKNPGQSHDIRGTAVLQEQAGGGLVLSFGSDFSTSSGPGVTVFLSSTNAVTSSSLNLGLVKQYSGAQSYTIPSGVQLTTYTWVVVHCVPVNVTFGYAQLQ